MDGHQAEAIIIDSISSELLVEVPRVPILLHRKTEAMDPLLSTKEGHGRIEITRVDEDTPLLRARVGKEHLVQRDSVAMKTVVRILKRSKLCPLGANTSMDCRLNVGKVKIIHHVSEDARVVVLVTAESLLTPLGHEVSTKAPLAGVAVGLVIKADVSINVVDIDVVRDVLKSSGLSSQALGRWTSVIGHTVGHVVLPAALGFNFSISSMRDVAMAEHESDEAPTISASVSSAKFIEVTIHASISSHETLHVDLTLGILEQDLLAELRDVMPTIALTSNVEIILAIFGILLEPAPQELKVILGNDIIVALPILLIVGVGEADE